MLGRVDFVIPGVAIKKKKAEKGPEGGMGRRTWRRVSF
jgi:hypothetical protein